MQQRVAMIVAAASAAAIIAIAAFLVCRDPTPHVSPQGTLSVRTAPTSVPTPPKLTAPPRSYPTAPPATVQPETARPVALTLPTIGVDAAIDAVGVQTGTNDIEVPPISRVGWYRYAATPGAPGSAVLLGHVDGDGQEGVFFHLGSLQPGDPVRVGLADGTTRAFRVIGRRQFPKTALPTDLFSRGGPSRLVLITCGGSFDASIRHYRDNIVVLAVPVR